ncbi:hypothetical protein DV735_g3222, partial [Chaetothyriales sp. CBS 134920]
MSTPFEFTIYRTREIDADTRIHLTCVAPFQSVDEFDFPNAVCSDFSSSPQTAGRLAATVFGKPFYVTTPIFYVNASPHVGHLYSLVLADVLKRWHQLKGNAEGSAYLLTGTDEHGMKVQKAAEKAKVDVKLFCDQGAEQFLDLAHAANASQNRFIRTTDDDHKAAVEHFWRELNHRGYLYESKHEGWYSVSDETFYPESQIHMILDPSTGRKLYASMETGKEVTWSSETNYHFKLSEFKDRLLKHYSENPEFIVPRERMNFIIKEVTAGLSDLSVSRPSSRLSWGIPVPGDETQTVYVWLDALVNYLSATGWPNKTARNADWIWPADCHVIGKDIIRFHCIYWPAFLMALDLPLPKQFLSHAHWTMNQEKMSKSLGNVVNPFFAMDRFGVDAIRHYMIRDGGIVDDSAYENSFVIARYKKDLQGGLGNLVSRIVRSKKWKVTDSVRQATGDFAQAPDWFGSWEKTINGLVEEADQLMIALNPREATARLMDVIYETNKMFHMNEIWRLAESKDPKDVQMVTWSVYATADALRVAAIALQPVMPDKMTMALDMLGVSPEKRSWAFASMRADNSFGDALIDVGKGGSYQGLLFPPPTSAY